MSSSSIGGWLVSVFLVADSEKLHITQLSDVAEIKTQSQSIWFSVLHCKWPSARLVYVWHAWHWAKPRSHCHQCTSCPKRPCSGVRYCFYETLMLCWLI